MINVECVRIARAPTTLRRHLRALSVIALLGTLPAPLDAQVPAASELRILIDELRTSGTLRIGGATVARDPVLIAFYELHGYSAAWTDPSTFMSLDRAIRNSSADGLDPGDYHVNELARASGNTTAGLDIVRSAALISLCRHLRYGRVKSQYPDADVPPDAATMAAQLRFVVESGRVAEAVASLRPSHFTYSGLVRSLADLRAMQAHGGWPTLSYSRALRAGDTGSDVRTLRERLAREGYDVRAAPGPDSIFDTSLHNALAAFQHRHALNEDGVLGEATLAELNVTIEHRIDQVRVNLERARWIAADLPDTFLAVNIAGAMTYLLRHDSVIFETRSVVGQPYTRTPVFRATIEHIELNPTWTVPPGIVDEVLAAVRRDPHYLERMRMHVIDHAGRSVSLSARDLSAASARTFPYTFRQDPGPANPLGGIKFVFPNRFNVYLHDTPARSLFETETRTFSHGCIRVQNPTQLAALILDDPRWTQADLETAIRAGTTQRIPLRKPLSVFVLYWTASADLHGELHYYRDVYGRDEQILRALDGSR